MTEADCIKFLELGVPATDSANKNVVAKLCLQKAISKLGMMKSVAWNRERKVIALTANKSEYNVGVDILSDSKDGWDISEIWLNDSKDYPVEITDSEYFNSYKRGSTQTGKPRLATYRTADRLLEFFPTPDSAYNIWVEFRKDITNFDEIPSVYHAPLLDYGLLCVGAIYNASLAASLAADSLKEMREDSLIIWDGTKVDMRGMSSTYNADSYNLRGGS